MTKQWSVDIVIEEEDDRTVVQARLLPTEREPDLPAPRGAATEVGQYVGVGLARRNPADQDVPRIGDELAASRALADLAHKLLDAAAHDIENRVHRPVHLKP
jgi:hypothetical protein